jgi:hypothetical protein
MRQAELGNLLGILFHVKCFWKPTATDNTLSPFDLAVGMIEEK